MNKDQMDQHKLVGHKGDHQLSAGLIMALEAPAQRELWDVRPGAVRFIAYPCDGPCLLSQSGRNRLGVGEKQFVVISSGFGSEMIRQVHRIPRQVIPYARSSMIWLNEDDFRLIGISPEDAVYVTVSDELMES